MPETTTQREELIMKQTLVAALLMGCVIVFAGCSGNPPQEVPDADLVGTLWTLESIEVPGSPDILPGATKVYNIQFYEDYNLKGQDDCNAYVGIFALAEDSKIKLDSLGTTLVGCGPTEIGHQYYQALHVVDAYEIKGNTLKLHFDIGSALKYRYME